MPWELLGMSDPDRGRLSLGEFTGRVVVVAGVTLASAIIAAFLWFVSHGLLVIFAAIVFSVMLSGLAGLLERLTGLSRAWVLTVVVLVSLVFFVGVVSLGGVRIANQAPQLKESMSKAIGQILGKMQQHGLNPELLPGASGFDADSQNAMGKSLLSYLGEFISLPIEITTDALVIVVAGIYFAAHPVFYVQTIISLIPLRRRRRAYEVAHEIGHALRLWLIGRFCAMISVGLLITAGLEVLDVKLALLLGLISSILTFMPYLGTIISAIPAILVALLQGPLAAFSVVLLFLIAHVLEGYILIPLIQQRALSLAPAYLILAQLLGWLAAGIFGVLLATPLAVVLTIIVQMIYLEDILGDKVHILGEHGPT